MVRPSEADVEERLIRIQRLRQSRARAPCSAPCSKLSSEIPPPLFSSPRGPYGDGEGDCRKERRTEGAVHRLSARLGRPTDANILLCASPSHDAQVEERTRDIWGLAHFRLSAFVPYRAQRMVHSPDVVLEGRRAVSSRADRTTVHPLGRSRAIDKQR